MSLVVHQPFAATVHNQSVTVSGNTAGASTWSGTNLVFSGGNSVTLSITSDTLAFIAPATARSNAWSLLGVSVVTDTSTGGPFVAYSDWLSGSAGYWTWIGTT